MIFNDGLIILQTALIIIIRVISVPLYLSGCIYPDNPAIQNTIFNLYL